MEYQIHTLPNGLRLIHQPSQSHVAYCAVILNTGSRDELDSEHGMTHFIEHLIFKGTGKRKAYHILSRLEDVGGEVDAYTTKEEMCVYAAFMAKHYERAVELLSDIVFNPTFPEKEMQREREVISDEINSYRDSPAEQIFDDFEDLVFNGHPLGRNILGTTDSLDQMTRDSLFGFLRRTRNTDQIVICSVGNIDFDKLVKFFEKHCSHIEPNLRGWKRPGFKNYKARTLVSERGTHQAHCVLGTVAYDFKSRKRLPLLLLNNLLAGPGMNSRLNLLLREKHGLVYTVESAYTPYFDTGAFTLYFGTDKENLKKATRLILGEFERICDKPLGKDQLRRAKQQMIGQIAISLENPEILMLSLGKSYLMYNKVDSLDTVSKRIESISSEDILAVAREVLEPSKFSYLTYL